MSRIKNKVRKSLLTATVLFMAIFLFAGPAWADDYQPGKKGSITIRLNDIGSYKGNVEFAVYQVGKPVGESNLQWQLTEKFAGCKVDLNALNTAEAQKEAADILEKEAVSQTADFAGKTDKQGVLSFPNLEQGIYLLRQTEKGVYGTVESFLAAIPYMIDGESWIYDVPASPKAEPLPSTPSLSITPEVSPSITPSITPEVSPSVTPSITPEENFGTPPSNNSSGGASSEEKNAVKTGDETPLKRILLLLIFASATGGVIVLVKKKRS